MRPPRVDSGYRIQGGGPVDSGNPARRERDMATSPRVTPLRRRRLVDDATQMLRDAILDGRFTAGARLRQTDLADQLAISRTPVREALGRLQHEGLVE